MKDRKLPEIDRPCPKCGDVKAHGPEYRRGIKGDEDLGEHLRYYCATCGYMTLEPTRDHDTTERREELARAFAARRNRLYPPPPPAAEENFNRREIESARRDSTRRPYGWK